MKKVNLLVALLLWAVVASAQSSLTLTNCAYLWKTGAGITGSTVGIGIETPGFPSPYLLIPMDSSQSCVTTFFANGSIAPEAQVTVNGFKDDKRAFFRASSLAQRAADFVLGFRDPVDSGLAQDSTEDAP